MTQKNNLDKSSVFSVIVTYGERFHLLRQVVDSCIREEIGKIIIVDNHSSGKAELEKLEKKLPDKLKVIYLNKNIGSACGFKTGIEVARADEKCQYLLLLDDDNVLSSPGSIEMALYLSKYFRKINTCFALSFFRTAQLDKWHTIKFGLTKNLFNNFVWTDFKRYFSRKWILYRYLKKKDVRTKDTIYPVVKIEFAPYGGLFFEKTLLDIIGLPNVDFVLYADDTEFTYRITQSGGALYLCADLKIDDIELEVKSANSGSIYYFYKDDASEAAIFYSVRNRTFLGERFITNRFIYTINLVVWFIYYVLFLYVKNIRKISFKLYKRRAKMIWKAFCDGRAKKLGQAFFEDQELKLP
jgi:GT2 family glycosyltransferase